MGVKETRSGKQTKEWILETSLKLFNEHGSQAISTKRIAKEMGISPGNLYYHFKNKEEIIRAIFKNKIERFDQGWNNDQVSSVRKFIDLLNGILLSWKEYHFFKRELAILLKNDPELRSWHHNISQETTLKYRQLIHELIDTGILRIPGDPKIVDSLLVTSLLIGENWLVFLDVNGMANTEENLRRGIELIIQVWRPYLIKDALDEINRLTEDFSKQERAL